MPELPEVETVRAGLSPSMEGRRIVGVTLNRGDLRFPFPEHFKSRLQGARVNALKRRAKFLLCALDTGETLLMHLGMSGGFRVAQKGEDKKKHDHVVFAMDGPGRPHVIYNDPRRFGFMELLPKGEAGRLSTLGPEPLSNAFNGPELFENLGARKTPVKLALLDQKIVAGLGNIYVCEALFDSGISPFRPANTLSGTECAFLATSIRNTLERAIAAGGSTLRDFAAVSGELGYFQHSFKVYHQEDADCPKSGCGGQIVRKLQSGRSSFFCLQCQI